MEDCSYALVFTHKNLIGQDVESVNQQMPAKPATLSHILQIEFMRVYLSEKFPNLATCETVYF